MKESYVLLVEGKDDQHVIKNLLTANGIPCALASDKVIQSDAAKKVIIREKGDVNQLLDSLTTDLKSLSNLERVGVILDADTDIKNRWQSVRNSFQKSGGVNVPESLDPNGTVLTLDQGYRKVTAGVWIMPDNSASGMLEDFMSFLIPDHDAGLFEHASASVDGIPTELRHFITNHRTKAIIHTWLAWQERLGIPLGIAINASCNTNAQLSQKLINWIRRLFTLP